MVVGSYSGLLKIWDYEMRETVVSRSFDKGLMIQCCAIDPQGVHIGEKSKFYLHRYSWIGNTENES